MPDSRVDAGGKEDAADMSASEDRAGGVSLTDEKIVKASLHRFIPEDNKGFHMVQNMGWQKGTGLGKMQTGELSLLQLWCLA